MAASAATESFITTAQLLSASIGRLKPTLMAIMADSTKTFRPSPVWCELLAVSLLMRRGAFVLGYGQ
ncbi:unnamed protein product [Clonostachys byssicola]|uniref:Uncharacterized protein n=1 Tax=Clonostachys byssicola TaxID=160290 RepID=A0A9N9Y4J1_9HYPO|nr:unnamed protein product [Clonostachys byssicola]